MTDRELSVSVDKIKRIEHRTHWYRFRHLLSPEHSTLPGADPITDPLHVLEVQRALAFREVVRLDQRIDAHRTGKPLPWQREAEHTGGRSAPDGPEASAVAKHYRDTGTQLRVLEVDANERTIVLGNFPGVRVTYRWTARSDGGFRLVVFDSGEV